MDPSIHPSQRLYRWNKFKFKMAKEAVSVLPNRGLCPQGRGEGLDLPAWLRSSLAKYES